VSQPCFPKLGNAGNIVFAIKIAIAKHNIYSSEFVRAPFTFAILLRFFSSGACERVDKL
jgi:hypothetical protein